MINEWTTTDGVLKMRPYEVCYIEVTRCLVSSRFNIIDEAVVFFQEVVGDTITGRERLPEDEKALFDGLVRLHSINCGEIVEFDKCFDNIISDTVINTDDSIYMPFDYFYINKWFSIDDYHIPGIAVFKMDMGRIGYSFFTVLDNSSVDTHISTNAFLDIHADDKIFRHVSNYLLNCINIINNPDKDIKEIERFPSHKKLDPTHRKYDPCAKKTTYITVGGELKRYIGEYNKRREAVGHNPSFIVRGHWRHFRSPRYKNKQGQSRWIYPYIKGMPEELVHRFVKVVPGDSEK